MQDEDAGAVTGYTEQRRWFAVSPLKRLWYTIGDARLDVNPRYRIKSNAKVQKGEVGRRLGRVCPMPVR